MQILFFKLKTIKVTPVLKMMSCHVIEPILKKIHFGSTLITRPHPHVGVSMLFDLSL